MEIFEHIRIAQYRLFEIISPSESTSRHEIGEVEDVNPYHYAKPILPTIDKPHDVVVNIMVLKIPIYYSNEQIKPASQTFSADLSVPMHLHGSGQQLHVQHILLSTLQA